LKRVWRDCMVVFQMGRALALLLTLVLGMLARPVQGGVAHAQDHSVEAAEPGDDVANNERRPTVVQRFERPRTGGEPDTSCIDGDELARYGGEDVPGAVIRQLAALDATAIPLPSAWRTPARSRGPPTTHR
jgi:hypothetical protein